MLSPTRGRHMEAPKSLKEALVASAAAAAAGGRRGKVYSIPAGEDGDEDISIRSDELPANADELLEVLNAVRAPLALWHEFALEYYRQGLPTEAAKIAKAGSAPDLLSLYPGEESIAPRARLLIALAQLEVLADVRGAASPSDTHARASQLLNVATEVSDSLLGGALRGEIAGARVACEVFHVTHAALGDQRNTAIGSLHQAIKAARDADAASSGAPPVPGCLAARQAAQQAEAMQAFTAGDYVKARELFVSVIRSSPNCDATVRVGLGFALYKLGHPDAAQAAFQRALQLDPRCALARTALAALQLASAEDARGENTPPPAGGDAAMEAASRALTVAHAVASLQLAYARAPAPLTALELSHAMLRHWAPLTLPGTPAVPEVTGTVGLPPEVSGVSRGLFVPAVLATRGSRTLLFLDDVSGGAFGSGSGSSFKLSAHQWVKVALPLPRGSAPGAAHQLVPVRVASGGDCGAAGAPPGFAMARIPLSALPEDIALTHGAALGKLRAAFTASGSPSESEPVLYAVRLTAAWGAASTSRGGLHVLNAQRSEQLARAALQATRNGSLRVDALYALGRAQHVQGQLDAAVNYANVLKERREHAAAQLGATQVKMLLHRGDRKATEAHYGALKDMVAARPDDRTLNRVVAGVNIMHRNFAAGAEHARKAADGGPGDSLAAMFLAHCLLRSDEPKDVPKALKACEGAVERLQRAGQSVPSALYNSAAVAAMRLAESPPTQGSEAKGGAVGPILLAGGPSTAGGSTTASAPAAPPPIDVDRPALLARAEANLNRALIAIASELRPGAPAVDGKAWASSTAPNGGLARARDSVSGAAVAFNFGRLRELQGRAGEAEDIYRRLSGTASGYWAADLRLALLARDKGDAGAAVSHAEGVLTRASAALVGSAAHASRPAVEAAMSANIVLGQLAEARSRAPGLTPEGIKAHSNEARARYTAALALARDHAQVLGGAGADNYAQLCLANLRFRELGGPAGAALARETREEVLRSCFTAYSDVLKRSPGDVYAANGLGAVLAEQSRLDKARRVFSLIREGWADAAPVTTNLAHVLLAEGHASKAVTLYAYVARRFGGAAVCVPPGAAPPSGASASATGGAAAASTLTSAAGGGASSVLPSSSDSVRTLLHLARAQLEAKDMGGAMETLGAAIAIAPGFAPLHFDLAYVQAEEGFRILGLKPEQRTLPQVAHAVGLFRASHRTFTWLQGRVQAVLNEMQAAQGAIDAAGASADARTTAESALEAARSKLLAFGLPVDSIGKLGQYVAHIGASLERSDSFLADARTREERAATAAEERARLLAERATQKRDREAADAAATEAQKAKAQERARAMMDLLRSKEGEWTEADRAAASAAASGKGRKGKKGGDSDDDGAGSVGSGGAPDAAAAEADAEAMVASLFGEDQSDSEEAPTKAAAGGDGKKRKKLGGGAGGKAKARGKAAAAAAKAKKAAGSDSDSSSSDSDSGSDSSSDSDSSSGSDSDSSSSSSSSSGSNSGAGSPGARKRRRTEAGASAGAAAASSGGDLGDAAFADLFGEEAAAPSAGASGGGGDDGEAVVGDLFAEEEGGSAPAVAPAARGSRLTRVGGGGGAIDSDDEDGAPPAAPAAAPVRRAQAVIDDEDDDDGAPAAAAASAEATMPVGGSATLGDDVDMQG